MGAAGDMLTAALIELIDDKQAFIDKINLLLDGKAVMSASEDIKCGVRGTHVKVLINGEEENEDSYSEHEEHSHSHTHAHGHVHEHNHKHRHTSIGEILDHISRLDISERVKNDAINIYKLLAQAESAVHGQAVDNIHFHEVGSIDALADILAVCMLMDEIKAEKVLASPVNVGGGTVKCSHGVLPVPAPATEQLLRGIPYYSGEIKTELCTPTGAVLLKYFVDEFTLCP